MDVLACDELPLTTIRRLPAALIVNTDPSTQQGRHWLAIYVTSDRVGYFFDSFGNTPMYREFPENIFCFLSKNCKRIIYSGSQVQHIQSTTCGEHCIFFLCNIQKGLSFQKVLNMYTDNLKCNDIMVCNFVKGIQPYLCRGHTFKCIQYANH